MNNMENVENIIRLLEPLWDILTVIKIEETADTVVYTYLVDNYEKDTAGILEINKMLFVDLKYEDVDLIEQFRINKARVRKPFTGKLFQLGENFDAFSLLALENIGNYVLMYEDYPQYTIITNGHKSHSVN